jgi:hypothetical protein
MQNQQANTLQPKENQAEIVVPAGKTSLVLINNSSDLHEFRKTSHTVLNDSHNNNTS